MLIPRIPSGVKKLAKSSNYVLVNYFHLVHPELWAGIAVFIIPLPSL
jgi:hypothetical protein